MKLIKLYFCLCLAPFFALGQTEDTPISVEWTTLEIENYSFEYPKDWSLDQTGMMGTKFLLFSPFANTEDQFGENVNLIIQNLTGLNLNLESYTALSLSQIENFITDFQLTKSKTEEKDGMKYQHMIYTGKQGVFELTFEQYFWIINETAYVMTFTSETKQYEQYKKTGLAILDSFKLN